MDKPVLFECDGHDLLGILHTADPPAVPRTLGVVFVVGGPQYRVGSHRQFLRMARELAASGYPVLRFDHRGIGDSEGAFSGFEHIGPDIEAALDCLMAECPRLDGAVIFGLCDAASAALMYVGTDPRVQGLVLANPWVRTSQGEANSFVRHYYGQRLWQLSFWQKFFSGRLDVLAATGDFVRKFWLAARFSGSDAHPPGSFIDRMLDGLRNFRSPALLLVSEHDLTAMEFRELCRASPSWQTATKRTNVHEVDCAGADHTFSSAVAHDYMVATILDWLAAKLPTSGRDAGTNAARRQHS